MFCDDVHNKLVSAHCTVTTNVLTMKDENHKQCIFPILPVNDPQSYMLHDNNLIHSMKITINGEMS